MGGRLVYLIGASGSGKDSLLTYARTHLGGESGVVFAHRYITRPHDAGGENHVALTEAEFAARLSARLFAMHWDSHGHRYGIGCEINHWLAKGLTVVMNGSREYLPEARRRYRELEAVLVSVSPQALAERLRARGRESEEAIARRVARAAAYAEPAGIQHRIANDGALDEAGEALVRFLVPCREEATACA
jgi:ribose 1,5-bisphosphokinase